MTMIWKLGDFTDGKIVREVLPVDGGSSQVSVDIHSEDTAEIGIIRRELTTAEDNAWKTTFAPLLTCVGLTDDSKAWNAPGAVMYAGFVNKLSNDIMPGIISAQLAGPNEYTKARIVADTDTPVTDPTTSITFSGADWSEVLCAAAIKCFSADGIPAGKPVPPAILGTIATPTGTTVSIAVDVTSVKTYHDVFKLIAETAGNGLEWRWVPRWASAAMDAWVWDFVTGTTDAPHIGEDTTINLVLSENSAKFSSYSTIIDSNDLYSKLYIQSKSGDKEAKDGADFSMASVSDTEFPILVERFFNPGVELTAAELTAQLNARLAFAAKTKYETNFSVEEKWDVTEWLGRVGNTLSISGVDGTISAGHDALVRCVGISFTPGKGTVKAELMQLGPTYPRLPKDRTQGPVKVGNDPALTTPVFSGGGGVTPTPTIPGGVGVDGVPSLGNAWGDEGRNPWDGKGDKLTNPDLADYKDITYNFTGYDGESIFHPYTACQNDGNRIYGLDHAAQVAGTTYADNVATHYAGGVDWATGAPLAGWKPFYIKKTYIVNGELGPVETVGTITAEQIKSMVAVYQKNTAYGTDNANYETSIMTANWIVDGRFYFALASIYRTKIGAGNWVPGDGNQMPTNSFCNSRVAIISSNISVDDGKILGDWRIEKSDFQNYGFPMTPFIARAGKIVTFNQFYQVAQHKYVNPTYADWQAYQNNAYYNGGGWYPMYPEFWYSPFGNSIMWENKPGITPNDYIPGPDYGLGSLWKNYSTIDSAFNPYAGFNSGTNNKLNSNGVGHLAFASDGYLYGTNRYAISDVRKIALTDNGVAGGAWQTAATIPWDNTKQMNTNVAVSKGWGFLAVISYGNVVSNKLFSLIGAPLKTITAEPYINFAFTDGYNQFLSYVTFVNFNPPIDGNGSASKVFSYDGRFYTFKLMPDANGVKNTIILHSMQIVQATA